MFHIRGALCVVWACVLMYQASADLYPLGADLDTDLDVNYIDIGPFPEKPEDSSKDYLLYKFIQSLRTGDHNNIPQIPDGVNWYALDNLPNPTVYDDLLPIMKRMPARRPATTEKPKADGPVIKPIRKWHNRKQGQKNVVCYLKLCNFRVPVK